MYSPMQAAVTGTNGIPYIIHCTKEMGVPLAMR